MTTLHQSQPVRWAGVAPEEARAALIFVHGRGASAASILTLTDELDAADGFVFAAPQAAGHTWYPQRFIAPVEANEPYLSSALAALSGVVKDLGAQGLPAERIIMLGFSQGACLALDYAARAGGRFGGVVALSGGLIGQTLDPDRYAPSLSGTPVFLGCSDVDPHIPLARVEASADLLRARGADVTTRIYPGMGHTINADELAFVSDLMHAVAS